MTPGSEFDSFAHSYQADLERALAASGEGQDYFARKRVDWVTKLLEGSQLQPRSILDYGCGIGGTATLLREIPGVETVVGLDASQQSLSVAREGHGNTGIRFLGIEEYKPNAELDLAYCNGVFHHIPVAERKQAVSYVRDSLRPGGLFAFWENNPWNPGARWVMSRCAFDRDAVMLTPARAANLLRAAGFEIVCTNFLFIFPKWLAFLRFLEPGLSGTPLGAQYMILGRKPIQ
jgi:SAM-dependent methyltransferase